MAATLAGAEEYFAPKNHIRAASWARYDPDQKEGRDRPGEADVEPRLPIGRHRGGH